MVNRFDVFLINLDAELTKDAKNTRPAVVLSPDELNRNVDTVIIAPLASTNAKFPTRIAVSFLGSERFVILDQIRTVDKDRLVKQIGSIEQPTQAVLIDRLQELFAA